MTVKVDQDACPASSPPLSCPQLTARPEAALWALWFSRAICCVGLFMLAGIASTPALAQLPTRQGEDIRTVMPESFEGRFVRSCLDRHKSPGAIGSHGVSMLASQAIGWVRFGEDAISPSTGTKEALAALWRSWVPVLGGTHVRLVGLVAGRFTEAYAISVSARAAEAVAAALVESGAPPSQIETVAMGKQIDFDRPTSARAGSTRALVALVPIYTPAAAPRPAMEPQNKAVELVQSLYQRYALEASRLEVPVVGLESSSLTDLRTYLDQTLLRGLQRDRACSTRKGVPCEVADKLLWASQDPQVCRLSLDAEAEDVVVSLYGANDQVTKIRFRFTQTQAGLRIADIVSEFGSLRERLSRARP